MPARFAQRAALSAIPHIDLSESVEHLRIRGIETAAFQANLAEESAVRDFVRGVLDGFGRLDILVNCAAIFKGRSAQEGWLPPEEERPIS